MVNIAMLQIQSQFKKWAQNFSWEFVMLENFFSFWIASKPNPYLWVLVWMVFMSSGENGNLSVGAPWFNLCHCNFNLLFSCTSKSNHVLTFFLYYPGKHTIFGRVCRGMEVIKRLGSVQTDKDDRSTFSYTFFGVICFT